MSVQMPFRAAASSSSVGPSFARRASSASIAASSSALEWPGLAVQLIWKTDARVNDCWPAVTSCAICLS